MSLPPQEVLGTLGSPSDIPHFESPGSAPRPGPGGSQTPALWSARGGCRARPRSRARRRRGGPSVAPWQGREITPFALILPPPPWRRHTGQQGAEPSRPRALPPAGGGRGSDSRPQPRSSAPRSWRGFHLFCPRSGSSGRGPEAGDAPEPAGASGLPLVVALKGQLPPQHFDQVFWEQAWAGEEGVRVARGSPSQHPTLDACPCPAAASDLLEACCSCSAQS